MAYSKSVQNLNKSQYDWASSPNVIKTNKAAESFEKVPELVQKREKKQLNKHRDNRGELLSDNVLGNLYTDNRTRKAGPTIHDMKHSCDSPQHGNRRLLHNS